VSNIQQLVFDCLPKLPDETTVDKICTQLPFDRTSIKTALARLRGLGFVEPCHGGRFRRTEKGERPADGRLGNANAKRKGP
jgi:predicted transcriptional regulator